MSETEPAENRQAEATEAIEAWKPLSQSALWQFQRQYFEREGVAAWSGGTVPMYVTSNPFIARAYARLVRATLRDWAAAGVETGQPVYIVELGAGSGRFAYHFLKKFWPGGENGAESGPRATYVMTEYNEALLDFWQGHPALQPFVDAGWLDFAHFDAVRPEVLTLRHSGVVLAPDTCRTPLVLIANYFFDSIPQDAFYLEDGQLHESLVAVHGPQGASPDDPGALGRLHLVYRRQAVNGNYYGEPELDGVLEDYRGKLSGSALVFPSTALHCIDHFRRLCGGRLLVLSCDKGYHREEDLQGRSEPGYEVHGSFSMGVNYHALGAYVARHAGTALFSPHRHTYLDVCAFLLGDTGNGYAEARRAFDESVVEFGPEDFFLVQSLIGKDDDTLKMEQALALLKLSGWDGKVFQTCFASLLARLPDAPEAMKEELRSAISRLWENYYHVGEAYDLPYDLGILLYKLGDYTQALEYFGRSAELYGPEAKTLYNMALCHYGARNLLAALARVEQAVRLDPDFEAAQGMRRKIQAEMRRGAARTHE